MITQQPILRDRELEIYENVSLSPYNSMRLPARGVFLAVAHSNEAVARAMEFADRLYIPWALLGGGSNVVFGEEQINTLFIKLGSEFDYILNGETDMLRIGAGTPLGQLVSYSVNHSLKGLSSLWGIPGTVGGAVAGNAGALQNSICEFVHGATVLDQNQRLRRLNSSEFSYGYRHSTLSEYAILEVQIRYEVSEPEEIEETLQHTRLLRNRYPVLGSEPSAGCIFRNPPEDSAGRLIESAGMKGARVGGAMVSEKHANFIVNSGGATPGEVMNLIQMIQSRVSALFKVNLEPEVKIFSAGCIEIGA